VKPYARADAVALALARADKDDSLRSLKRLLVHLRRSIREPVDELSRAQRLVRFMIDLGRHGYRQLRKDQAPQMAAALTYRTIFSLIPIAVLSMLVFRAFVGLEQAQDWVRNHTYAYLGWNALVLQEEGAPTAPNAAEVRFPIEAPPPQLDDAAIGTGAAAPAGAFGANGNVDGSGRNVAGNSARSQAEVKQIQASVDARIDDLIRHAWELNLGNIGVAGAALFIWAALALLVEVEDSFNAIMNCSRGRSWLGRIMTYWAFVTLGPVLLFVSLYAAERAVDWSDQQDVLGPFTDWIVGILSRCTGLAATWLLLVILYVLMPNTAVRLRPAMIGSFVAAALWEGAKWGFKWYVTTFIPYSALYGSLALIPLFLFWLYLTWLIFLFGLELTSILQSLHGRKLEDQELWRFKDRLLCDPQWFIPLMAVAAEAFEKGRTVTTETFSRRLNLPNRTVVSMCDRLERSGFLHRLQPKGETELSFTLARPPERISVGALIDLGRAVSLPAHTQENHQPGWEFVTRLFKSQREAVRDLTLASVVGQGGQAGATAQPQPAPSAPAEAEPARRAQAPQGGLPGPTG
jgi:membrane protein